MNLAKIFYSFMVVVLVALVLLLGMNYSNSKSINYLVNDSLTTKQDFIVSTNGMLVNPNVDPGSFQPKVEQSLEYCEDEKVVYANGKDVSQECSNLQKYSDENYGGE